jgi:hypothetical protein
MFGFFGLLILMIMMLMLSGCSGTTLEVPLADGRMATLTSYRLFVATAAQIDLTDPTTGLVIGGSYSSDPQAQQAAAFNEALMGLALKGLQLAAPGP